MKPLKNKIIPPDFYEFFIVEILSSNFRRIFLAVTTVTGYSKGLSFLLNEVGGKNRKKYVKTYLTEMCITVNVFKRKRKTLLTCLYFGY